MVTPIDAYFVTVERRGVSPLKLKLVVAADSEHDAGGLASALAERERGGTFEPARVRPARTHDGLSFDEAA
jgi:hypothetical protein